MRKSRLSGKRGASRFGSRLCRTLSDRGVTGLATVILLCFTLTGVMTVVPHSVAFADTAGSTVWSSDGGYLVTPSVSSVKVASGTEITFSYKITNHSGYYLYAGNSVATLLCENQGGKAAWIWPDDERWIPNGSSATISCTMTVSNGSAKDTAFTDEMTIRGLYYYNYYNDGSSRAASPVTVAAPTVTITPAPTSGGTPPTGTPGGPGTGTGKSPVGAMTVTKTANSYLLEPGGGDVTYTYTVTNNSSRPIFYDNISDDKCGSVRHISGLWGDYFEGYYIPGGASARFACTMKVTQDTTNTVRAAFYDYYDYPLVATTKATVNVKKINTPNPALTSCDSLWYGQDADPRVSSGSLGYVTAVGGPTKVAGIPKLENGRLAGTAAVAVDPTDPRKVYYVPRASKDSGASYDNLKVYDSSTGVTSTAPKAERTPPDIVRLAFDSTHTLWTVDQNMWLWSWTENGGWQDRGKLTLPGEYATLGLGSGDIVFDGLGTMWLIGSNFGTREAYLFTVSKEQLASIDGASATFVGAMRSGESDGVFDGLAFDTTGTLYATGRLKPYYADDPYYLYTVDKSTGAIQYAVDKNNVRIKVGDRIGDLSSCALPKPELKISKTATPQDGFRENGTIDYTITIENLGNLEATGVTFQDSIPAGTTYVRDSTKLNGVQVLDVNNAAPYINPALIRSSKSTLDGVVTGGDKATITFQVEANAGATKVCNSGKAAFTGSGSAILTDDPALPGADDPTCLEAVIPAIWIDKASTSTTAKVGDNVTYTYDVTTNSAQVKHYVSENDVQGTAPNPGKAGTETLKDVKVTDDRCSPVSPVLREGSSSINAGDRNGDGLLQSNETWKYTCTSTIAQSAIGTKNDDTQGPVPANNPTRPGVLNTATVTAVGAVTKTTVRDTDKWLVTTPIITPGAGCTTSKIWGADNTGWAHEYNLDGAKTGQKISMVGYTSDIALSPDGKTMYGLSSTGQLMAYDLTTNTKTTIAVTYPAGVSWTDSSQATALSFTAQGDLLIGGQRTTTAGSSDVFVVPARALAAGTSPIAATVKFAVPTSVAPDGWSGDFITFPDGSIIGAANATPGTTAPTKLVKLADGIAIDVGSPVDPQGNKIRFLGLTQANGTLYLAGSNASWYALPVPSSWRNSSTQYRATQLTTKDIAFLGATSSLDTVIDCTPTYTLAKSTQDGDVVMDAAGIVRTYSITVTNTSAKYDGTVPAVVDTPSVPNGFSITKITVDGAPATMTAGSFTIPGRAPLAHGNAVTYTVTVTYVGNPAVMTSQDWTALNACSMSNGHATSDPSKGLFNAVAFSGTTKDADGAENNVVCTNVTPVNIVVAKLGSNCGTNQPTCPLQGAMFAIYGSDPRASASPEFFGTMIPGTPDSTFTSTALQLNQKYWLLETKAPQNFELSPVPVAFTITDKGVVLDSGNATSSGHLVQINPSNPRQIDVIDVRTGELPVAGGRGTLPPLLLGLLCLIGAGAIYYTTSCSGLPRARGRRGSR